MYPLLHIFQNYPVGLIGVFTSAGSNPWALCLTPPVTPESTQTALKTWRHLDACILDVVYHRNKVFHLHSDSN